VLSAFITGGYFASYAIGSYRNLLDMDFNVGKKIFLYIMTLLLVPIAAVIEGSAVVYAIASPVKGFDVIKK
jgi:hypothetical protein